MGLLITAGFFTAGAVSSSESLLLDEAAFFFVAAAVAGVTALTTGVTFLVSSSDESESDDDSCFLLFDTGVTGAAEKRSEREVEAGEWCERSSVPLAGVVGVCFLLAGGARSSESELELLDGAALRLID